MSPWIRAEVGSLQCKDSSVSNGGGKTPDFNNYQIRFDLRQYDPKSMILKVFDYQNVCFRCENNDSDQDALLIGQGRFDITEAIKSENGVIEEKTIELYHDEDELVGTLTFRVKYQDKGLTANDIRNQELKDEEAER